MLNGQPLVYYVDSVGEGALHGLQHLDTCVDLLICLFVDLGYGRNIIGWVIICMMVLCKSNVIVQYDRRRLGLPSATLDMEYDNNIIES